MKYPVESVTGVFDEGQARLAEILRAVTGAARPRIVLVADYNVVQRHAGLGTRIGAWVQAQDVELAGTLVIGGGEKIKNDSLQSVLRVATMLVEARLGARDAVVVLGGGTLMDVVGFAAAQVRGGIPVVRMPTSVVALLGACYADRAAVDFASVKDALSVAAAPAAVVIDTAFAASVLDGVWRGGFAEAVRLALVRDANFFDTLVALADDFRARKAEALETVVAAAKKLREKTCPTDFGLWSALRLEMMSGYKLPHGYALAIGILIDCGYAVARGLLPEADRARVAEVLNACGALEGAVHSRHLLGQGESLLRGLDAWALSHPDGTIPVLKGLGKGTVDETPDREILRTVAANCF